MLVRLVARRVIGSYDNEDIAIGLCQKISLYIENSDTVHDIGYNRLH